MRISLAAAIGLLCLGSAAARAQPTARDSLVLHALSRFQEGDRIRVALLRSPFVGRYVATRGDTLFFGTPGQPPMAFRLNAVDSLWRVARESGRGAVVGGLVGLAAGLVARDLETGAATVSAGALVGWLIGSRLTRWRLVYGNPQPQGFDLVRPDPHTRGAGNFLPRCHASPHSRGRIDDCRRVHDGARSGRSLRPQPS
jgi:hypothetical protein